MALTDADIAQFDAQQGNPPVFTDADIAKFDSQNKPSLGSRLVNAGASAYDAVANVGEQLPRAAAIIPNMLATTLDRISTGKSPSFGSALKSSFQDLYSGKSSNMTQFLQKYSPELTPSDKAVLFNPNFYKSLGTTLAGNAADVAGNLTTPIWGGMGRAIGETAAPLLETPAGQVVKKIATTPIGRKVAPEVKPAISPVEAKPILTDIDIAKIDAQNAPQSTITEPVVSEPQPIVTVGYRYGKAGEGEKSYNTRENRYEKGLSMASAAEEPKNRGFATLGLEDRGVKKSYYRGEVLKETGGDDEHLFINHKEITKKEYDDFLKTKEGLESSLALANKRVETNQWLLDHGYNQSGSAKEYFLKKVETDKNRVVEIKQRLEKVSQPVPPIDLLNKSGKANVGMMTAGLDEFIKQDVAGGIQKVSSDLKDVVNGIRITTTPASMGEFAKATAGNLREQAANMSLFNTRTETAFANAGKVFDKLTPESNIDVMSRIEGGQKQATPQLQGIADSLRTHLDNERTKVQQLGTGKLQSFYQDYFPHIWEDPKKAEGFINQFYSKKPLEGSKSFLKQRTFPTIQEGIDYGLKPISDNPVDLVLLKTREMEKYIMAQKYIAEEKATGRMEFVKIGDKKPDGYVQINDKIGTVYRPGEKGELILSGHYYAPEQSARIVNNYLSPGIRGTAAGKAYEGFRNTGNLLNQAQLGISAFHAGFTTIDAAVSKLAIATRYLAQGDLMGGVKRIAEIPTVGISNILKGDKFLKELRGLTPETKEMASVIDGFIAGGGRTSMDRFYASGVVEKMRAAFKSGNIPGGILRTPFALIEGASKPIMEWLVPRQKLGIFYDMARFELDKLPANATREQMRSVMGKAWDSVDNRMGQLVYDNLFWNKSFKDLSMASVRSVGWNLGTIRELGGGLFNDTPKFLADIVKGKKPQFTNRMAYTVALPVLVGTIGGIMNYLFTGEHPKEIKDYFFPRTGRLDAHGDPERVSLPSYMKDIYHYSTAPGKTLSNKLHPLLGSLSDMLSNKDFYGTEIVNKDDPFVQKVKDEASYVGKQFVPFGFRYAMQPQRQGASKVLPFIGVTPAPYDLNMTKLEREVSKVRATIASTAAQTKAQFDKYQTESVVRSRMTYGMEQPPKELYQAVQSGKLTSADADKIWEERNIPPLVRDAKRLSLEQVISLWKYTKYSDQQEKDMFYQIIGEKLNNAWDNRSPQEQADLQPRLDKIKADYWKGKG